VTTAAAAAAPTRYFTDLGSAFLLRLEFFLVSPAGFSRDNLASDIIIVAEPLAGGLLHAFNSETVRGRIRGEIPLPIHPEGERDG